MKKFSHIRREREQRKGTEKGKREREKRKGKGWECKDRN
jgi:hypothetical protein